MLGCLLYCMLGGEDYSSCSCNLEGWRSLRAIGPYRSFVHLGITGDVVGPQSCEFLPCSHLHSILPGEDLSLALSLSLSLPNSSGHGFVGTLLAQPQIAISREQSLGSKQADWSGIGQTFQRLRRHISFMEEREDEKCASRLNQTNTNPTAAPWIYRVWIILLSQRRRLNL
jgi:hypothetical protein